MLMSHRSSINDSQGYFTLDAINPGKNSDWENAITVTNPARAINIATLIITW
jgi:hypothetical protein